MPFVGISAKILFVVVVLYWWSDATCHSVWFVFDLKNSCHCYCCLYCIMLSLYCEFYHIKTSVLQLNIVRNWIRLAHLENSGLMYAALINKQTQWKKQTCHHQCNVAMPIFKTTAIHNPQMPLWPVKPCQNYPYCLYCKLNEETHTYVFIYAHTLHHDG